MDACCSQPAGFDNRGGSIQQAFMPSTVAAGSHLLIWCRCERTPHLRICHAQLPLLCRPLRTPLPPPPPYTQPLTLFQEWPSPAALMCLWDRTASTTWSMVRGLGAGEGEEQQEAQQ